MIIIRNNTRCCNFIVNKIEKSRKHQQCTQNPYALFTEIHVPWRTSNFIQTPLELYRKIEEMAGGYGVEVTGFEIADRAEENFLSGDMNSFTGVRLFGNDNRKILLIKIRGTEQDKNDYLFESQIRYILSQLQMEFLEYRCMGVVI